MNSKLKKLMEPKAGLNFLVQSEWINKFKMLNQEEQSGGSPISSVSELNEIELQRLQIPYYDPSPNLDTFLLEYKSQILEQITHKCNFLNFNSNFFSLQPNNSCNWTPVSATFWKLIKSKLRNSNGSIQPTFTFLNQVNQAHNYPQIIQNFQIQIVFCSKKQVTVFVGYLPKNSFLIGLVQQIGNQFGFVQAYNSKISFPAKNNEQSFYFYQIKKQNMSLCSAPDNLILAFNMQKNESMIIEHQSKLENKTPIQIASQFWQNGESTPKKMAGYRHIPQNINGANRSNSNRAVVHDGTLSTGADSFFSFQQAYFNPITNQNCQNFNEGSQSRRIPQILKNVQQQDIRLMKDKANQAINGPLIMIPQANQQKMTAQLEMLAEQIINSGDFKKKNNPMAMSIQNSQKQSLKLQNLHSPGYGQPFIDQSQDTEN